MIIIAKRIIKQIFNDKRSLPIMLIAPVLILTLIFLLLGENFYKPTVALDKKAAKTVMGNVLEKSFESSLRKNKDIIMSILPEDQDMETYLKDKKVDAVITFKGQDLDIAMLEPVATKTNTIVDALKDASEDGAAETKMKIKYLEKTNLQSFLFADSKDKKPKITYVYGSAPGAFEKSLLNNKKIKLVRMPQKANVERFIEDKSLDGAVIFSNDGIKTVMKSRDIYIMPKITDALQKAVGEIKIGKHSEPSYLYGSKDDTTFDSLAYFFLCVLSFFLIFVFSGISFVSERTAGTLERLMRTPVKSISVVAGYAMGFGFFAVIQSTLLILAAKFVFKATFAGPWWSAMLIMLMVSLVAVLMGILISVMSKSEFQVVQSIPVIIIPQIFFSGLIPVETLPYHLDYISYVMPLYYGSYALKNIMVFGMGIGDAPFNVMILVTIIIALFAANVLAVSKTRRSA